MNLSFPGILPPGTDWQPFPVTAGRSELPFFAIPLLWTGSTARLTSFFLFSLLRFPGLCLGCKPVLGG